MRPDLKVPAYEIQKIGEAALASLSSGHGGTVMAVVTRAAYLLDDRDELLWLTAAPGPMHRRCLQISSSVPRMKVGSRYQVRERAFVVDGESLNLDHPSIWKSSIILPKEKVAVAELYALVDAVYGQLIARHEPVGWGCWIAAVRTEVRFREDGPSLPDARVEAILYACRFRDPQAILQHAAQLVGLGEGLTPSGDDFLGGLFFCFYFLRAVYPEILDHSWNYSAFIPQFKSRTNRISYTFLKDHAEGHALEPLHQLASVLLQGRPAADILPFAEELICIGHSTGWNLLTGFLVGMNVMFPR
jgi:hypothetical protein